MPIAAAFTVLLSVSPIQANCDIGAGTDSATLAVKSRGSTVFAIHPFSQPATACLRLGECGWDWHPESDQRNAFETLGAKSATAACPGALFNSDPDVTHPYEAVRQAICVDEVEPARPVVVANDFVTSLGSLKCNIKEEPILRDGALTASAEITIGQLNACIQFRWKPSTGASDIAIIDNCSSNAGTPLDAQGQISVTAQARDTRVSWRIDHSTLLGNSQSKAQVSSASALYLRNWADAVRIALGANLDFPFEDPLGVRIPGQAVQPYLTGRWGLAIISGASESDAALDMRLRDWMAELQLRNPNSAKGTLFRQECMNPLNRSICNP